MDPFPKKKVEISAQKNDQRVDSTVSLLLEVYNGTTPLKVIESGNIRKALLNEILDFQKHLLEYYDEDNEEDDRRIHLKEIKKHLKKSSPFTAFKRWIIKDIPDLRKDFEQYFD
jgi:hypothetical protein